MDSGVDDETYNPWSVVNLVFEHLAAEGLHPQFGGADPGEPAARLLEALAIRPAAEGNRQVIVGIHQHLEQMRTAVLGAGQPVSGEPGPAR